MAGRGDKCPVNADHEAHFGVLAAQSALRRVLPVPHNVVLIEHDILKFRVLALYENLEIPLFWRESNVGHCSSKRLYDLKKKN